MITSLSCEMKSQNVDFPIQRLGLPTRKAISATRCSAHINYFSSFQRFRFGLL